MGSLGWVLAITAALAAAAAFGGAGVLQHRATHQAETERPLQPRLLLSLIRLRPFRSGVLLGAAGFGLQVVALNFGPLILVQPLLVTGVLFFLAFGSVLDRHRPDGWIVAGALLALVGLSLFLLVAQPSGGTGDLEIRDALPLGLALLGVVAVCLLVASRLVAELQAVPLAAATAVCYGLTAGLVRSLTSPGVSGQLWDRWELYAVAVVGPAGFLLNQNAFQSGMLGAVATATITVGDPIVAIGVGLLWLGESVATGPVVIACEVLTLMTMAAGIWLLAGRAQTLAEGMRAGPAPAGKPA
ncbi:MAG TPA: DMT family transporter [Nocardioidaceae bacterium]|nr:DMT family transporter [Nocardioidaceae bacterium]